MDNVVVIAGLHKTHSGKVVLKDLNITIKAGEIFALLGPNGAGKSTTINIISTLMGFDRGDVLILGKKRRSQDDYIRRHIGIVFQNSVLDERLSVLQNMMIRAALHEHRKSKTAIIALLRQCQLEAIMHQTVKTLSGGERRKADIARALLSSPSLLILDEPTTGLDPQARKQIWELIQHVQQDQHLSVLFTTHYIEEVAFANQVAILTEGQIKWQNTPAHLMKEATKKQLLLQPYDKQALFQKLKMQNINYTCSQHHVVVTLDHDFQAISYVSMLRPYLKGYEVRQGSLEEAYLSILGGEVSCDSLF